jgi:hypothetical protein
MKQLSPEAGAPKKGHASVKSKKAEVEKHPRRQPIEDNTSVRMAHRAYEIYYGADFLSPLNDWLEAEREIASHEPPE